MPKYLVLEQTGGTVVGNVRRTLVEAHNVKDAIMQALGVDDKGHIQATSTTDRLMVVEVARIATIDVHHHLPTVATMDELETVYESSRGGDRR